MRWKQVSWREREREREGQVTAESQRGAFRQRGQLEYRWLTVHPYNAYFPTDFNILEANISHKISLSHTSHSYVECVKYICNEKKEYFHEPKRKAVASS